jgi:hypothetical protein
MLQHLFQLSIIQKSIICLYAYIVVVVKFIIMATFDEKYKKYLLFLKGEYLIFTCTFGYMLKY